MPPPRKSQASQPAPVPVVTDTVEEPELIEIVCYEGRELIYSEAIGQVEILNSERCMELLGWEFEGDEKFGHDYLLTDLNGNKVRCHNNIANRPLYGSNLAALKQDILNSGPLVPAKERRWKFNGEPIIVGCSGLVLNGQHTLIAVPLAEQERLGENKYHWETIWGDQPVSIKKMVVFGISEDDETINTMDTCKPRSLMDVIFRSGLFSEYEDSPGDRKLVSRMTEYCIRTMWERTWMGDVNGWTPRRTHSESMSFLERHPTILKAVKHIHQENVKSVVAKIIGTGYAAASLYLMASSNTDGEEYHMAQHKDEKLMVFDLWEKACEFWTLMAKGSERMMEVRYALGQLGDAELGTSGSIREKLAVLANAWQEFRDGVDPTKDGCALKLGEPNDFGMRDVLEWPLFGGIDRGYQEKKKVKKESEDKAEDYADSEDEELFEEELGEGEDIDNEPVVAAKPAIVKKAVGGIDPEPVRKQLKELRSKHGGRVLLIRNEKGWVVWESDAEVYAEATGAKVKRNIVAGLMQGQFSHDEFKWVVKSLYDKGFKVAACYPSGNDYAVTYVTADGTEEQVRNDTKITKPKK